MSSTSDDRLTKLPGEILRDIIVQLETKSSIDRLLEAYPSMSSLYSSCERGILESILANLFADDVDDKIRKDVLAIIKFPKPKEEDEDDDEEEEDEEEEEEYYWERTRSINVKKWQWSDWPQSPKIGYLQKVHRLVSRIIEFIEDYISKATSEYPPRAYLGLPDLKTGKTSFMGSLLETRFLPFTTLRRSERYRLLRAFVRYELLCEIHNTREDKWRVPKDYRKFNAFGTPNAPDPKALLSVHEYYIGLYGAVFAHCGDAWLPDLPSFLSSDAAGKATNVSSTAPKYLPLEFPDNLFFGAEAYLKDLGIGGSRVTAELAGCGLDLLTRVLSCLKGHPRGVEYIKEWLEGFVDGQEYMFEPWIRAQYNPRHDKEYYSVYRELIMSSRFSNELLKSEEENKKLNNYLSGNDRLGYLSLPRWCRAHKLQLHIYQQRAWGLFDDHRFYPDTTCHFPTIENLVDLQGEDDDFEGEIQRKAERRKRRSKHWQDYLAGVRPDEPVSLTYYERPKSRLFDAVAPMDLPWIADEYQYSDDQGSVLIRRTGCRKPKR
ncbi:uncharacterized protein FIESC28_11081 [Fusarium coffeatum]|uniref:Uncharacterized protein n=1 Tax=Fusarium coffeatum TaxID=231269 RepID=A0A366QN84_9HYPO|nr:uncharacterized protein FIESC28_11081 [Fusarium coffeatum]RBR06391.1 hypothetical protein FIESC28_11081 [Fusarium coffeatum]